MVKRLPFAANCLSGQTAIGDSAWDDKLLGVPGNRQALGAFRSEISDIQDKLFLGQLWVLSSTKVKNAQRPYRAALFMTTVRLYLPSGSARSLTGKPVRPIGVAKLKIA